MNVNVEALSSVKKRLSFEVPAVRVSQEIEKSFAKIRKNAAIKGFRKGKVPASMVEKYFADRMADDVVRTMVNETLYQAMAEHRIFPVSEPIIDSGVPERGSVFAYTATVEVFPEIEPTGYDSLEVKKERFVADDAVIDSRLQQMQEQNSQLVPAPEGHEAANGDFAVIDFTGYLDGEPFENGAGQDYDLELGSGRFIPGFEEQLLGLKVGEEKRITVKFPEEYGFAPLAGKEAEFDVAVKGLRVKEVPELNDDFAKEMGEFETLADLRAKMVELHESQEKQRIEAQLRERVVHAVVEANPMELPETAVQRQLALLLQDAQNRLARQRMNLQMMGMNEDMFRRDYRVVAENQLKGSLLLAAIARKEGLAAGDDDVAEQVKLIAAQAGQDEERIAAYYRSNEGARDNLLAQIVEDKALSFILGKATITEVSKEELAPAADTTEE
jgi:trigger factor